MATNLQLPLEESVLSIWRAIEEYSADEVSYEEFKKTIYFEIGWLPRSGDHAAEFLSLVTIELLELLSRLNGTTKLLIGDLRKASGRARYRIAAAFNKRKRALSSADVDSVVKSRQLPRHETKLIASELMDQLLSSLDNDSRHLLLLILEGGTDRDISNFLEISLSAVKSRKHRLRKKIEQIGIR